MDFIIKNKAFISLYFITLGMSILQMNFVEQHNQDQVSYEVEVHYNI